MNARAELAKSGIGNRDGSLSTNLSAAFAADPDWIKLRQQSLERYGQIPSFRRLTLYRATDYSPIR